jgi:hypothetical protein
MATRYGLDGPGIETRWGEIFRSRPDRPRGPPSLLYNGYRVSFRGVKRPGRGVDHPPPSSAEVKERVQLYLYSPFGPSWPVLGRTLPYRCKLTPPSKVQPPLRRLPGKCLQGTITYPHAEPDQSSPSPPSFLKINFNIIMPSTPSK